MKLNWKNKIPTKTSGKDFLKEVGEMERSKRDVKETCHRGWKMVEYIDTLFGMDFGNAELYDDKGKMVYHSTTDGYMTLGDIQIIIGREIRKREGKDESQN